MPASFEIVAHRGAHDIHPENSLPAFEHAVDLGADAVELDVRLTSDRVPVVFHYFYLDEYTTLSGPVYSHSLAELREARLRDDGGHLRDDCVIPTLEQVLDRLGTRIGLEIELKGPELEAAEIVASVLRARKGKLPPIEVTSFETTLLVEFRGRLPELPTDLLIPRTQPWMKQPEAVYEAVQRGRMAGARAIHLHSTQLAASANDLAAAHGLEIHAWDVNDRDALQLAVELGIPRICTDELEAAVAFRRALKRP